MAPRTYPLWTTTFALHRLSPLYHGDVPLDNARLELCAKQLRDLVSGEVLRGVRIGLDPEDDALARVGALQAVRWSFLKAADEWEPGDDDEGPDDYDGQDDPGILVEIIYDKATYKAILLKAKEVSGQVPQPGFAKFPLLLLRMPNALKTTFINYIETTFDTRASLMKLPSEFIVNFLEKYLDDLANFEGRTTADHRAKTFRSVIRDLLVTVGFNLPSESGSLRTMDILVEKSNVLKLLHRGRSIQKVPGQNLDNRPFMASLAHYMSQHTALKLNHEIVSVVKVACGAFVLGSEGKVKFFVPPADDDEPQARATKRLVDGLLSFSSSSHLKT